MSCGCTVIATKNVGVHSSLITNNTNGYLFNAGNVNELKDLLTQFITQKIPDLGGQAREEIVLNWSAQREAENLMKVYKSNLI